MKELYHLLVIDDMKNIHEDFKNILTPKITSAKKQVEQLNHLIFNEKLPRQLDDEYILDYAFQGLEGVEIAQKALVRGIRYAIVFVDMIMPPGIDGMKTVKELWKLDPNVQIVICSAYSQHSWEDIKEVLGNNEYLHKLDKPFNPSDVLNLVKDLTGKWKRASNDLDIEQKNAFQVPNPKERFEKAIESLKKIQSKM